MTTIIHEYSINLGLAGSGPWLRLISWVYEKKTKQEVNEYIKAKINELIMLFYICPRVPMSPCVSGTYVGIIINYTSNENSLANF